MNEITGKVWLCGDNIDTDIIIPSQYCILPLQEASQHAFEAIFPHFAKEVKKKDIIVAGENFGCGSSREQAPRVLKELKIGAIIAKSFARIFFRNAINIGLPVLEIHTIVDDIKHGDKLKISFKKGEILNLKTNKVYHFKAIPSFILEILEKGGLANFVLSQRR